jgi:NYN domain
LIGGAFFLQRLIVFLDYENVRMQARRCFKALASSGRFGHVRPANLGRLVVGRERSLGRAIALHQVRIYRGMPDGRRDPRGRMAFDRQARAWRRDPRVQLIARPLRYPRDPRRARPVEKGIDVCLAIDFVTMALRGEYDVGVLMSSDTDLVPALESVLDLAPEVQPQVAAWAPTNGAARRLRVPGTSLWCHELTAADYAAVADPRNYLHP